MKSLIEKHAIRVSKGRKARPVLFTIASTLGRRNRIARLAATRVRQRGKKKTEGGGEEEGSPVGFISRRSDRLTAAACVRYDITQECVDRET